MAHDHHFVAVKTRHAAENGSIIGVTAITMNFAPLRENALDVVERIRPLRVPRQFGFFPGAEMCGHLFAQELNAFLKLLNLAVCALVLSVE